MECVINISEGTSASLIEELSKSAGVSLVDVHSDPFHNRSVFTLCGSNVYDDALSLTEKAFQLLDIRDHYGVHPRGGVVDVVPFVPIGTSDISEAIDACRRFSQEVSSKHSVPIFIYDTEHTLPFVRKNAFQNLLPDYGPNEPHPRLGWIAAGAREPLVAYNLYLSAADLSMARHVAHQVRSDHFRTLGLKVGDQVQVSANLVDPLSHGIYEFFLEVNDLANVSHGELVGLAPLKVIEETPKRLWKTLGLSLNAALEVRAPLAKPSSSGS